MFEILDAERIFSGPTICPSPMMYSIRLMSGFYGMRMACFLEGIGFKMLEWIDVLLDKLEFILESII